MKVGKYEFIRMSRVTATAMSLTPVSGVVLLRDKTTGAVYLLACANLRTALLAMFAGHRIPTSLVVRYGDQAIHAVEVYYLTVFKDARDQIHAKRIIQDKIKEVGHLNLKGDPAEPGVISEFHPIAAHSEFVKNELNNQVACRVLLDEQSLVVAAREFKISRVKARMIVKKFHQVLRVQLCCELGFLS